MLRNRDGTSVLLWAKSEAICLDYLLSSSVWDEILFGKMISGSILGICPKRNRTAQIGSFTRNAIRNQGLDPYLMHYILFKTVFVQLSKKLYYFQTVLFIGNKTGNTTIIGLPLFASIASLIQLSFSVNATCQSGSWTNPKNNTQARNPLPFSGVLFNVFHRTSLNRMDASSTIKT